MSSSNARPALIVGVSLILGLAALGALLGNALLDFRQLDRSVTVKGLSEREQLADVVIWPIAFVETGNELTTLYQQIDDNTAKIRAFLTERGIAENDISIQPPAVTDKVAQQYGNNTAPFRYSANQTVTVYSNDIETVRSAMRDLSELGKQGVALSGDNYQSQTEYLFTRLNEIKPQMIEEATRKAREVAEKFADDSNSDLGKIKTASQGQFSIYARDKNNPHIKKIRVVSTIQYYLSD